MLNWAGANLATECTRSKGNAYGECEDSLRLGTPMLGSGDAVTVQDNPYAPPTAEVADITGADPEAEAIRREHIKHEASIRSVGILYYLGGVLMGLAAILFGFASTSIGMGLAGIYAVLALLSLAVGYELRELKPWARIAAIVFAVIGLLGFPLGTLINGYILYLLLSQKGRRIFQPDYLHIVAATPEVKYRTSVIVWIVLGLLLLGFVAAISLPFLMGR